jgi:hypothetical protein
LKFEIQNQQPAIPNPESSRHVHVAFSPEADEVARLVRFRLKIFSQAQDKVVHGAGFNL